MKPKTRWSLLAILLLVAASSVLGVLLVRQTLETPTETATPVEPAPAPATQSFQLYFLAATGTHLLPENRDLPVCSDEDGCIAQLFTALAAGPQDPSLAPVLPPGTRVLGVRQEAGVVIADFSPELSTHHPGGSLSELMTVYALADTLAVNFPHLRQLTILIDGQPVETLKGHVALNRPIVADFQYTRPPATAETKPVAPAAVSHP